MQRATPFQLSQPNEQLQPTAMELYHRYRHLASSNDGQSHSGMTVDFVRVPTSNHVAEMIGANGCKIKALRLITDTYIETPQRGQDPVFLVAGPDRGVRQACQKLQEAADFFTRLRSSNDHQSYFHPERCRSVQAGEITEHIRVPVEYVGCLVGVKGRTIIGIQRRSQTFIVSPNSLGNGKNSFKVIGLPENVEKAKNEMAYTFARYRLS